MALIPGVSRSGATISGGLFMGYTRAAAARYSFLLAMPAVLASGAFEVEDATANGHVGADHLRDGDRVRGRLRGNCVVYAIHLAQELHAVRLVPDRARHRHHRAGLGRRPEPARGRVRG